MKKMEVPGIRPSVFKLYLNESFDEEGVYVLDVSTLPPEDSEVAIKWEEDVTKIIECLEKHKDTGERKYLDAALLLLLNLKLL